MLQFPTNFKPDNSCVDVQADVRSYDISFTFNGDEMYGAIFRVYDYKTDEMIDTFFNFKDRSEVYGLYLPYLYNGEQFSLTRNFNGNYVNKRDYVIQVQLLQGDAAGSANVCDMIVTSGVIQNVGGSSTEIVIEQNINGIYEWGYDDNTGKYCPTYDEDDAIIAEMQIEIDDERHTIMSYDPSTGNVEIDSAFAATVAQGVRYRIYANYIISSQYFLSCRRTPNLYYNMGIDIPVDSSAEFPWLNKNPMQFWISGAANGWCDDNSISYFNFKLYKSEEPMPYSTIQDIIEIENSALLLEDSGKVYSEHVDYTTVNCWGLNNDNSLGTGYLYPIVHFQTRYGTVYSSAREWDVRAVEKESDVIVTDTWSLFEQERGEFREDGFSPVADVRLHVEFSNADPWDTDGVRRVGLFRENAGRWQFIQQGNVSRFGELNAWDNTAPLNSQVEYKIVPVNIYGDVHTTGVTSMTVDTKSTAMSIMGLHPVEKGIYSAGSEWLFEVDINDPTISFNIGHNVHTGYDNYPTVSRMGIDYATGNVTTDLSYISCPDGRYIDDVALIKAWRRFIKNYEAYLLKDLKGNVFVVQLVNTPTVGWEEQNPVRPTTISFDWIEVDDADKIRVLLDGGI